MEKNSFLDTNIIFHYSNYTNFSSNLTEKCYLFVKNKKGEFILCWAVLEELNKIIIKRNRMHKAVVEKVKNIEYSFENNPLISFRDIPNAKKLYEKFKNLNLKDVKKILESQRRSSELKIEKFLQFQVDGKVIPLNQINNELVNRIHDIIPNHADCKILASALQLQSKRDIFLFVTADGNDFDPNGYKYLEEDFKINYPEEGYKFPELFNLMFVD